MNGEGGRVQGKKKSSIKEVPFFRSRRRVGRTMVGTVVEEEDEGDEAEEEEEEKEEEEEGERKEQNGRNENDRRNLQRGRITEGSKGRSRIIGDIIFAGVAACSFVHRVTERRNDPDEHTSVILVAMQIAHTRQSSERKAECEKRWLLVRQSFAISTT